MAKSSARKKRPDGKPMRTPDDKAEADRFVDRLKKVVGEESVRSFGRRSGVSETVLRKYLSGESDPSRAALRRMAAAGGVRVGWLANGEGDYSVTRTIGDIDLGRLMSVWRELERASSKQKRPLLPDWMLKNFSWERVTATPLVLAAVYNHTIDADPLTEEAIWTAAWHVMSFGRELLEGSGDPAKPADR